MKIEVRTHRGGRFFIEVKPDDTIASMKEKIEAVQGKKYYPAEKQLLSYWHRGLRDNMTIEQSKIADNGIVMVYIPQPRPNGPLDPTEVVIRPARSLSPKSLPPSTSSQPHASTVVHEVSNPEQTPAAAAPPVSSESSIHGQAASNLVAGQGLESTIQQILDIGGGSWDRDTVIRALSAAFNNPEKATEYLYSEFPQQTEVPAVARDPAVGQVANPQVQAPQPAMPASGPNADPLNLFPQGPPNIGADNLDFLRNNPQFQALRAMLQQANPQVLQSMLQELEKQNPNLMQFIQEHQSEFSRLMNEPIEGKGDPAAAVPQPQSVFLTPEERAAIQRLEDMGFTRERVMVVFFAFNKNEQQAANYLSDHRNESDN